MSEQDITELHGEAAKRMAKLTGCPFVSDSAGASREASLVGQRRINLIWESTQASIALLVVLGNLITHIYSAVKGGHSIVPAEMTAVLFLVVGFYFGRTNHSSIGGIGRKATDAQEYLGR